MFKTDEMFLPITFKRIARQTYKIGEPESDRIFDECLRLGFVEYARHVGMSPGMAAYKLGQKRGEVTAEKI